MPKDLCIAVPKQQPRINRYPAKDVHFFFVPAAFPFPFVPFFAATDTDTLSSSSSQSISSSLALPFPFPPLPPLSLSTPLQSSNFRRQAELPLSRYSARVTMCCAYVGWEAKVNAALYAERAGLCDADDY